MAPTSWLVQPETERVPLGDSGEWLDCKLELTYGDRRRIRQQMITGVTRDEEAPADGAPAARPTYQVDPTAHELATVEAYLVGWSLRGPDGKPLDISTPTKKRDLLVNALSEEAFALVRSAIEAHIDTQAAKKKAATMPSGATTSAPSAG